MQNIKEKRDLLVKQLNYFDDEATKVRKQIDQLDHDTLKARKLSCVGKYYNANERHSNDKFTRVLFIYGIGDDLRLDVLEINYSLENKSYYGIDTNSYFDPTDPNKDYMEDAVEITKEEFIKHYLVVQERIKKAMDILYH